MNISAILSQHTGQSLQASHNKTLSQTEQFADLLQKKIQSPDQTNAAQGTKPNNESSPQAQDKYLAKLKKTTEQFEAIFINMMFKEMRKSLNKHKLLDGGMAENIFKDMLYDEYSQLMAKNSKIGISEMLYDQLAPQGHKKS